MTNTGFLQRADSNSSKPIITIKNYNSEGTEKSIDQNNNTNSSVKIIYNNNNSKNKKETKTEVRVISNLKPVLNDKQVEKNLTLAKQIREKKKLLKENKNKALQYSKQLRANSTEVSKKTTGGRCEANENLREENKNYESMLCKKYRQNIIRYIRLPIWILVLLTTIHHRKTLPTILFYNGLLTALLMIYLDEYWYKKCNDAIEKYNLG